MWTFQELVSWDGGCDLCDLCAASLSFMRSVLSAPCPGQQDRPRLGFLLQLWGPPLAVMSGRRPLMSSNGVQGEREGGGMWEEEDEGKSERDRNSGPTVQNIPRRCVFWTDRHGNGVGMVTGRPVSKLVPPCLTNLYYFCSIFVF